MDKPKYVSSSPVNKTTPWLEVPQSDFHLNMELPQEDVEFMKGKDNRTTIGSP
ncbi:hypothetical protein HK100_009045, partial [Physocladia obscura]